MRPFNIAEGTLGFGPMPAPLRVLLLATALAVVLPARAVSQASPYIPLDDPRLPLLEHLIARGDVADPSPMMRPIRRSDAVRALTAADSATGGRPHPVRIIRRLREAFEDPAGNRWSLHGRLGVQAYTHSRRDALHPAGPDGVQPYVDLGAAASFGNVVLVTRPAVEPRVTDDPDWPGRRDVKVAGRLTDGYISAQFKYVRLLYGQMDWNWGPAGVPGIPLSNYGYERQGLAIDIGNQDIRLSALATDLHDEIDSLGQTVHRYYFVHRLHLRLSDRLSVAPWEGVVVAGPGRNFESRYRNPLSISYLANSLGLGDRGNVMLGVDVTWRAFRRSSLEAQLALDDLWVDNRKRNRDRWGFTVGARGPLFRDAAWRAFYTQVSSLALRAFNPAENFTDAGVGIGRNFSDFDQLTLRISYPFRAQWLVSPELTVLRQGEGRINDPYPVPDANGVLPTPALFVGVVERTYRAALGLSGRSGPLDVFADAGLHHVVNAGHVRGQTKNRIEGRLQMTLGLSRTGTLR